MINSKQTEKSLYFGGDLLTFILTLFLSIYFFSDNSFSGLEWYIVLCFFLLWLLLVYWRKLYAINFNHSGLSLRLSNYIKAYIILIGIGLLFCSLVSFDNTSSKIVLAFVVGFPVLAIPMNFMLVALTNTVNLKEDNKKYALVAGIGKLAESVERQIFAANKSDCQIRGFINCNKEECVVGEDRVVSELKEIHQYLRSNPVDEIIIALPYRRTKKIRDIVVAADYYGIRVKYIPDYQELFGKNYKAIRYGQFDAVNARQLPLDETFSFLLKNTFDKVFSLTALVLMAPFLLALAVWIKLDSPGPVFYCPIRIGKGGKAFKVFKFRSMRENDNAAGGCLSTQKDDPRITKLGRIMRKYSLDELPQFLNVLLGDMSVVGPRPHRSYLNQQLQESEDKYMIRHYFKPGITGWAQVNGWRGPTETKEQKSQRTLHDLWYVENWSLQLDLKIIFMTIFSRNVHKSAF